MRTINNCHFSVLVNGVASGFFTASHGLRQGDPLSPALFIIASEYLSRGLNDLYNASPELYYYSKKGLRVSHLAYADDLIIFSKGSKVGLEKILQFLKHYERVSG